MAGRRHKPTAIKALRGTLRKHRLNTTEPVPVGDLVEPPGWLNDRQRESWLYVIANAPSGLLKKLDCSVLEIWVVASVFHREAAEKVAQVGQVVKTPLGFPVVNPYMANMNKQAQIMLKAASELGFTPASRPKVHVDNSQKSNPFGDFADPVRTGAPIRYTSH